MGEGQPFCYYEPRMKIGKGLVGEVVWGWKVWGELKRCFPLKYIHVGPGTTQLEIGDKVMEFYVLLSLIQMF